LAERITANTRSFLNESLARRAACGAVWRAEILAGVKVLF
jgi:hypothetical protein